MRLQKGRSHAAASRVQAERRSLISMARLEGGILQGRQGDRRRRRRQLGTWRRGLGPDPVCHAWNDWPGGARQGQRARPRPCRAPARTTAAPNLKQCRRVRRPQGRRLARACRSSAGGRCMRARARCRQARRPEARPGRRSARRPPPAAARRRPTAPASAQTRGSCGPRALLRGSRALAPSMSWPARE